MTVTFAPTSALDVSEAVADATRLETINRYHILNTPPESNFDRIARLICDAFDLPMGVVSIIDAHRQWYKASSGMKVREAYAPDTICRHTLVDGRTIVVPDARADSRFADSPLVKGDPYIRFCASVPLRAYDGSYIGTVCGLDNKPRDFDHRQIHMLEDIGRIAMDALETRRLADTDMLTGALSHRAFLEVAERAIQRSRRFRQDLICVVVSIDQLADITAEFGDSAGDRVLTTVSKLCKSILRDTDHFGRIGGQEFAILLEQADNQAAFVVAEKVRRLIAKTPIALETGDLHVTVSCGSAQASASGHNLDILMASADARLYDAKKAGNNCTRTGAVANSDLRRC